MLRVPRAKDRLAQIGPDDIGHVLNYLNGKAFTDYLRRLPEIKGWSRGTEREKQRQKREIAKAATGSSCDEHNPYWNGYRVAWFWAAAQRVGSAWPFTLEDERLRDDQAAATLTKTLISTNGGAAGQPVSREVIEEILAFSPFEIADEAILLLSSARSAAEIEREKSLEAIPARIADLRTAIERLDAEMKEARQFSIEASDAVEQRVNVVANDVETSRQDVLRSLADLENRLSVSIGSVNAAEIMLRAFEQRLVTLEIRDEGPAAAAISSVSGQIDAISEIKSRLSTPIDLAEQLTNVSAPKRAADVRRPSDGPAPRFVVKDLKYSDPSDVAANLDTWASIYAAFRGELAYMGLSEADANVYGLVLTAGLRARQLTILGASIAYALAFAVYPRVVGGPALTIEIPIGCRQSLHLAQIRKSGARSVLISGLSRAPFDVVGGDVRNSVLRCQMGWPSRAPCALVGSFEAGPTALPLSPGILELGPYIDLDAVSWNRRSAAVPARSEISLAFLEARRNDAPIDQPTLNELDKDIAAMGLVAAAAWKASMRRFFYALAWTYQEHVESGSRDGALLSDAMYRSWIIPLLAAQEQDPAKRDERLSNVNSRASPKINRLLQTPILRPW